MRLGQGNKSDKSVTYRQVGAVLFIAILSPIIRIFPGRAAALAGKAAWLSPLCAAPLLFLLAAVINRAMKNTVPGEGLPEVIIKAVGKTVGRIILGIIGLWLVFYLGIVVRSSSERLISTMFQTGMSAVFSVTILAVALVMAMGKVRSLGRMSEIFLVLIGTVLVVTIAAAIKDCSLENLIPVTVFDLPDILMGALPVVNVVSTGTYIAFLDCSISGKKGRGYWRLTVILITITALTAVTIGVLSSGLITRLQHPFFVMVRDITILGIIERIEAVVIVLWEITDLVYMAVLLKVIGRLFSCTAGRGSNNLFAAIGAAIALIPAYFFVESAFELNFLAENIIPILNMLVTVLIVPLLLVVGIIRK